MLSSAKIKYIQNLGHKKFRDEEGLFIAEGPRLVGDLLLTKKNFVKKIFAINKWIVENKNLVTGIEYEMISEKELERITQLRTPHEVLALVRKFDEKLPESARGKIILALDRIQD